MMDKLTHPYLLNSPILSYYFKKKSFFCTILWLLGSFCSKKTIYIFSINTEVIDSEPACILSLKKVVLS